MSLTPAELSKLSEFESHFSSGEVLLRQSPTDLFKLANKFRKMTDSYAQKHSEKMVTKRIAVISTFTSQHLVNLLNFFLSRENIRAEFYEADFNSLRAEVLDPGSGLYKFAPELVFVFTDHHELKTFPKLFSTAEEVGEFAQSTAKTYISLWEVLRSRLTGCQIFQNLFVTPLDRQLGGLEANYLFSKAATFNQINLELINKKPAGVLLLDFDYFAAKIGKAKWFDETGYYLHKQAISIEGMVEISRYIAKLVASYAGKVKKCLVVDLDNTLWGGVIGDDGLEGIVLDPTHPLGEAFINFQKYLKGLKDRGVLLAACSKNYAEVALEAIENHPHMILRKNDFVAIEATWENKVDSIQRISEKLRIGLDSLVFFDDNPVERQLVSSALPDVMVVDVPQDPVFYIRTMEDSLAFEWVQLSQEDLFRADTYVVEQERNKVLEHSVDYPAYLKSLELVAEVAHVSDGTIARFAQLINKSNQFNVRTKRYTEAEIQTLAKSPECVLFSVDLEDRFTKYGIISCVILKKLSATTWFVDTWVMSCRALKLGVEELVLTKIADHLRSRNATEVVGEYLPTKKNMMVAELFDKFGFATTDGSKWDLSGKAYALELVDFKNQTYYIKEKA